MSSNSPADAIEQLWSCVRPDEPVLGVSFSKIDKGWWRLETRPGAFYDFYAKRVGEGAKASTDPGIASSRATVIIGLEKCETWEQALEVCLLAKGIV